MKNPLEVLNKTFSLLSFLLVVFDCKYFKAILILLISFEKELN